MSLLSNFVASHVVNLLEAELLKNAPHLQDAFVSEIKDFTDIVGNWVKAKSEKSNAPAF